MSRRLVRCCRQRGCAPLNAVTSLMGAPVVVAVLWGWRRAAWRDDACASGPPGASHIRSRGRLPGAPSASRGARARQPVRARGRTGLPARSERHRQIDAAAHAGQDAAGAVGHGGARRRRSSLDHADRAGASHRRRVDRARSRVARRQRSHMSSSDVIHIQDGSADDDDRARRVVAGRSTRPARASGRARLQPPLRPASGCA